MSAGAGRPRRARRAGHSAVFAVTDAAAAEALNRRRRLAGFDATRRRVSREHAMLWDTPEWGLLRRGLLLATFRRGGRDVLRLEGTGKSARGFARIVEETASLPSAPGKTLEIPDGPVRVEIAATAAGRPLVPLAGWTRRRTTWGLVPRELPDDAAPGPRSRLVLDEVEIRPPGGGASVELRQIALRVEGKAGRPEIAARRALARGPGSTPAEGTVLLRALRSWRGTAFDPGAPPPPLAPDDPLDVAVRGIVARQLRRIREEDPGVREGRDPEHLHDLRVAFRRLREAVRVFRPGVPKDLRRQLLRELEWIGPVLGEVRDLDVHIEQLAADPPSGAPTGDVDARLRSLREAKGRTMLEALSSPRYLSLLAFIDTWSAGGAVPGTLPESARVTVLEFARLAVPRALDRVLRLGARCEGSPAPRRLHRLRIRAKRLRYLLEFLEPVGGDEGRRLVRAVVRLQDLLGAHQDEVVAAELLDGMRTGEGAVLGDRERAAVAARAAWHAERAAALRAGFPRAWRRFLAVAAVPPAYAAGPEGGTEEKKGDADVGVP